jgi:molybdopterin/thiamine biosynthesis adenylyltransferase
MNLGTLAISGPHFEDIKSSVFRHSYEERSCYVLFSRVEIEKEAWSGKPLTKFVSREVIPIEDSEIISASDVHITWKTDSFVAMMRRCRNENLVLGIVHSHAGTAKFFSEQDDSNESELYELLKKRNGSDAPLISVVLTRNSDAIARCWIEDGPILFPRIFSGGDRFSLFTPDESYEDQEFLNRQALALGPEFNRIMSHLRVGVIGGGATGSAALSLIPRLGIVHSLCIDKDFVEESNLNRLHGATKKDAELAKLKVDVLKDSIDSLGLSNSHVSYPHWVTEEECRDALKSCDILIGATDDHNGRTLINRFAYFYNTPLIDMGLALSIREGSNPPEMESCDGRVTVVQPGTTCLLCRDVINPTIARDQALKQADPEEYERRKEEAYVFGEGNPSPAVITFTTAIATMAMEELIHRFQGLRGPDGHCNHRIHKFNLMKDRRCGPTPKKECPLCASNKCWGKGDMKPFLDRAG